MTQRYTPAYIQHRKQGAFPTQVDPWAEAGRYFHQIHSGMINHLQAQLQDKLMALGYQAGKEASLQIFANREPDLYVQDTLIEREPVPDWNYEAVATALQVEPGTAISDEELELDALHITHIGTGELVTVIEIISPRNKTHTQDMARYRDQRSSVFLEEGINVVEIDATRSIQRLLRHTLVESHAYHIAVYLPGDKPRVLISDVGEALKPFALPLRGEAVRVETQSAYDHAYQQGAIAGLIEQDGRYTDAALPFPSTLTAAQRQSALMAVQTWRTELNRLAAGST